MGNVYSNEITVIMGSATMRMEKKKNSFYEEVIHASIEKSGFDSATK